MDIQFGELHPLQNSLVLNLIFEHCGFKDLKNCRLVSRGWLDASRLAWRSSAVARINTQDHGRQLPDFRLFSRSYAPWMDPSRKEVPFTNYHLRSIEDCRWFYNFWGVSMKFLKLESVRFENGNIFLKTIFNCCENLEKLELVGVTVTAILDVEIKETSNAGQKNAIEQINWSHIKETKRIKSLTIFHFTWEGVPWMEFLNRLPSLQSVALSNSVSKSEQFFKSIRKIREQNPTKINLKLIGLNGRREPEHFLSEVLPVLSDPRLHLEDFFLGSLSVSKLGDPLSKIFNNHTSSLRRIALWNDHAQYDVPMDYHFPCQRQFQNLQELCIIDYPEQNYLLMLFLKHAPNLRRIIFLNHSAQHLGVEVDRNHFTTQDIKLNYCSELVLTVPDLTPENLKHLISWMPNVKKLRIQRLNNEMFSMVCDGWSNLVVLDVGNSKLNDSGFTGLDIEDVAKVNKNGRRSNWRPVTVPRANITCFKELKRFDLSEADLDFGCCANVHGFQLMQNLKHVNIDLSRIKGRSRVLLKNLRARYPWPEDED